MPDHIPGASVLQRPADARSTSALWRALTAIACPSFLIDVQDYTIRPANARALQEGPLPEGATCYAHTHHREQPCARDGQLCPLKEVRRTKALVIVRHVHYDREGRPCLCEAIGLPIADDRNKITHVLSCTRDLSDREVVTWANGAVPPPDLGHDLTGRERQVLRLIAEGLGNLAIALQLRVTVHTVKYHVRNLLRKLGAANRAQAVSLALQHGLMHPPSRPDLRSRPGSQRD